MEQEKAKQIFENLYQEVNGRALSLEGREKMALSSKSYVYGEVVFDSFVQLIKDANPPSHGVFCDCGSGTGKAVFVAHLAFDFRRCVGIELVDNLYEASAVVLEKYEKEVRPTIANEIGDKKIALYHGSFLDGDFSDVDLVFMNSTCFQEDLMEAIELNLNFMKPNSQVISLSKSLRSPKFEMYRQQMYEFSWGQATGFFHRKIKA